MNELVDSLTTSQSVINGGNSTSAQDLKDQIERGYVFVKFTQTRGGTDLGMKLDDEHSDISNADFETSTGSVHLEGKLKLNYEQVQCIADIDLESLEGKGFLKIIESEV